MAGNIADPKGRPPAPFGAGIEAWELRKVHSIEQIWPLVDEVADALAKAGFSTKQVFSARLAIEEAVSNGVRHGNRCDARKSVHIRYHVDAERMLIAVEDEGPGFDPAAVPDPLAPENLEREGGRGILLIRNYMTWVGFTPRGNCIQMILTRK